MAVKSMVDLQSGQLVAERYCVLRLIGRGGMGAVYLVQHADTEEHLALKILHHGVANDEIALERFRREARAPARIDSDYVARVYDTGVASEAGDAPFLVMDYLRGDNLQRISESLGALPRAEVIVYMKQVARALDKAHAIGIVHRDMKPDNVFLTTREDGSPCLKVLDFGIAKLTGAAGDLERIKATSTGDVFGTPLYMSPEQCLNEIGEVGPASDVWSFGLVAHRLLTGGDFWQAKNLTHLIGLVAYEPIPKPSEQGCELGEAYDVWFARCCARDPTKRFESAVEAIEGLAEALEVSEDDLVGVGQKWSAVGVATETAKTELALTASALSRTQRGSAPSSERLGGRAKMAFLGLAALVFGGVLAWLDPFAVKPSTLSVPSSANSAQPAPAAVQVQAAAVDSSSPESEESQTSPSASAMASSSAGPSEPTAPAVVKKASRVKRAGPSSPSSLPLADASASGPSTKAASRPSSAPVPAAPVDPLAGRH